MPVYKDKRNNKWFAQLNYATELGEYKSVKSRYFETKREAEDELAKMRNDRKTVKSKITFNDVFEEYIKDQKDKVKPITHSHYKPLYEHIKPYLGDIPIEQLTIPKYKAIKGKLNETRLSTTRKNRLHKFICTLLKSAYQNHGILNDVPNRIGGFSDPTKIEEEIHFFTEEQFKTFREEFKDDITLYCLYGALFYEGLRIGEALALDWKSVNLNNGSIKINKTYSSKLNSAYKDRAYYITSPKTKASNRTIPIEKDLLEDLKELYIRSSALDSFSDDWFVFGGYRPMSETRITNKKRCSMRETRIR